MKLYRAAGEKKNVGLKETAKRLTKSRLRSARISPVIRSASQSRDCRPLAHRRGTGRTLAWKCRHNANQFFWSKRKTDSPAGLAKFLNSSG